MSKDLPEILTKKEVCSYLRITSGALDRLRGDPNFPAAIKTHPSSRKLLWSRDKLRDWVKNN